MHLDKTCLSFLLINVLFMIFILEFEIVKTAEFNWEMII